MENLVAERADDVGLKGVLGSTAEFVVRLGGGNELILGFASAVGGTESVVTDTGNVGAFSLGALLDQHQTTPVATAERVGSVASTGDGVLNNSRIIIKTNSSSLKLYLITSVVRMKADSPLPISSETPTCNLVAKAFLRLIDHSESEASASNPVI